jgi:hypothetical protein
MLRGAAFAAGANVLLSRTWASKMLADATLIEQLLMRARADASPSPPAYFRHHASWWGNSSGHILIEMGAAGHTPLAEGNRHWP